MAPGFCRSDDDGEGSVSRPNHRSNAKKMARLERRARLSEPPGDQALRNSFGSGSLANLARGGAGGVTAFAIERAELVGRVLVEVARKRGADVALGEADVAQHAVVPFRKAGDLA